MVASALTQTSVKVHGAGEDNERELHWHTRPSTHEGRLSFRMLSALAKSCARVLVADEANEREVHWYTRLSIHERRLPIRSTRGADSSTGRSPWSLVARKFG